MSAREIWRRAYSEARRTRATGRGLAAVICDALDQPRTQETFWGEHGLTALKLQRCLGDMEKQPRPLFQSLAETVLNRFGTKNPFRAAYEYGSQAWRIADRADTLRRRLIQAGRLGLDNGGYVREVLL